MKRFVDLPSPGCGVGPAMAYVKKIDASARSVPRSPVKQEFTFRNERYP